MENSQTTNLTKRKIFDKNNGILFDKQSELDINIGFYLAIKTYSLGNLIQ